MSRKKTHCPDTGGKRAETVKDNHGSQLSGLEKGRSDMVCHRNGSPNRAAEAPSVLVLDSTGMSERFSGL